MKLFVFGGRGTISNAEVSPAPEPLTLPWLGRRRYYFSNDKGNFTDKYFGSKSAQYHIGKPNFCIFSPKFSSNFIEAATAKEFGGV